MTTLVSQILAAMAAVTLLIGGLLSMQVQDLSLGSVAVSNEYRATSTGQANINGEITSGETLIKTGYGAFGSVVITGDNTGLVHFYNATTSNAGSRSASRSTSTLHLGTIAASAADGTYVFDVQFTDGLLMVIDGTAPSSTITFR